MSIEGILNPSSNGANGDGGNFGRSAEGPAPMGDAAYHGVVGEIVRTIEPHTEADPAAVLVSLLVVTGNLLGRRAGYRVEGDWHGTNLFAVVVGETSKARKGTSLGRVRQVTRQADAQHDELRVMQGLSSAEGVVWQVRDPVSEPVFDDGAGEWVDKPTDPGVDDRRLLVIEPEFASVLRVMRREGNTLSAALRSLWDDGSHRFLTKTAARTRATNAHVSILAHITSDELRRELGETDRANGFANRFIYVCARRSKLLPDGGQLADGDLASYAVPLMAAKRHAENLTELDRNDEARDLWHEVYADLSEGHPGMFGAITGRAEAQVIRLAVIFAVLDERDRITRPHLEAALEVWRYCEASAAYIFGESLGDPVADQILAELRQRGGRMARTDIRNVFSRHKRRGEIDGALDRLRAAGAVRIECEPTGGRPVGMIVLTAS